MLVKNQVLETVNALPNNFSIDELVEKLILLEKIQKGLDEVAEGKVFSTEEAKEKIGF